MRDGKELGASTMHARASAGDAEYFDAAMRSTLLTRVAEDTGERHGGCEPEVIVAPAL